MIFPGILLIQSRRQPDYTPPDLIDQSELVISSGSVQITAAQSLTLTGVGLASSRLSWAPRSLYHNGKTYRVINSYNSTDQPYGWVRMFVFDDERGFVRPVLLGNIQASYDSHFIPVMEIAPDPSTADDTIYVLQENPHDTPLNEYKSRADNEWSKFSQLTDIGTELSYPHILRKDNGNRAIWSRGMAPEYDIYVTEATDKMESWGTQVRVSEGPLPDSVPLRHYPGIPFGFQKASGKWNLLITARNDTGESYYRHYWVETDDTFRTYNNIPGTWSRHIVDDGVLTDALLNTNAKYYEADNNTTNAGFPCAGMSSTGIRVVLVRGSDGTMANAKFMYYNGGWQTKALDIPDITDGPIFQAGEYVMVFSATDIRFVVWRDVTGFDKPYLYRTTDLGDTYELLLDFGSGIDKSLGLSLPNNIMEIPDDQNFEIQLVEVGTAGTEITHRKIAAWNTIQAVPAVSVTEATSMNWNSTGLLHYRMTNGDITKVGNNISAATDLFGIRNATGVNNPQWDGSAFAAFLVASSRAFSVGTPASLVTVNACTFVCVGKFTNGLTAHLFNCTQSSVASGKFWGFKVETSGLASIQISDGGTSFQVLSTDNVADGNAHVIICTLDGRSNPHMWIDGKKQYFSISIGAGSALWTKVGKGPSSVASLNVASIGRTDFTTDTYTTWSLGEIAFFNDVLPTEEILARSKMLCTNYGITFQTEYSTP